MGTQGNLSVHFTSLSLWGENHVCLRFVSCLFNGSLKWIPVAGDFSYDVFW